MFDTLLRFLILGVVPGTSIRVGFIGAVATASTFCGLWFVYALKKVFYAKSSPALHLDLVTI